MLSSDSRDRTTVAWLLAPYAIDDFVAHHFEREPVHISRNIPGYYDRYFSLAEMERVLFGSKLRTTELHLFKDGAPLRVESYNLETKERVDPLEPISEKIDPDRVSALFANGSTVNLVGVNSFSPSVAQLTAEMEMFFRCAVSPNVYLTPPGNQGFTVHWDTHDTVIAQVEGSKTWRVYDSPVELPLDHQRCNTKLQKPSAVRMEIELKPGDLLYIPRGYFHDARTNDGLSLHVTFGLFPVRWVHLITAALNDAAESDPRLRRNAIYPDQVAAISEIVAETLTPQALLDAMERSHNRFSRERRNLLPGQLRQLGDLQNLSEDSMVAKREHVLYDVSETELKTLLAFSGKTIGLAKPAAAIIHELENVSAVPIKTLLKHDADALKIVRKLIQEGFAVQCAPTAKLLAETVA